MRKLWNSRPMWIALVAIILLIVLPVFSASGRNTGDGLVRTAL